MQIVDTITELIETTIEQQKLSIEEKIREWAEKMVMVFALVLFTFFVILFSSLALANWLNTIVNSTSLGYLIVCGVYSIGLGITWLVWKHKPKP
jgi:hypothetical protein